MEHIVIFGAGGFGRDVAWLIEDLNKFKETYDLLGFIVDNGSALPGEIINGYPVLGGLEYLEDKKGLSVAVALGSPVARVQVLNRLARYSLKYPNLIHPSVIFGVDVKIGIGNVICAGSILTVNVTLGSFCQLNLKTTASHDSVLLDFATTACGVDLAGYSLMDQGSYMGNHSTLLPSIKVGAFANIGAGAVVNRDIPPGATAVGVPARIINQSAIYEEMKKQIPEQLNSVNPFCIRKAHDASGSHAGPIHTGNLQ